MSTGSLTLSRSSGATTWGLPKVYERTGGDLDCHECILPSFYIMLNDNAVA